MAVFFHVSDVKAVADAAFLDVNSTNSDFFLATDTLPASFVNDVFVTLVAGVDKNFQLIKNLTLFLQNILVI